MSLIDRDYMRREGKPATKNRSKASNAPAHSDSHSVRKSPSEASFRLHLSKDSDGGRFSCIRCGRSHSTKEAAAVCFRSHNSEHRVDGRATNFLSKIKRYMYKIKRSITNLVSRDNKTE
jgi:hypothetical protein